MLKKFCLEYAMKVVTVPLIVENILACEKAANTVKGHAHYEWGKPPKLCRKCKQTDKVEIKCFLRNFEIAELSSDFSR